MVYVVAEQDLDPPISAEDWRTLRRESGWCRDLYGVRHLDSYLSGDGRRLLCVWDAPDAEAVRQFYRTMALPTRVVWTAEAHGPQVPLAVPPPSKKGR